MTRSERGQSEVIGVVLLLGITIAAVTATVATGSVALGLVTDEAQSAGVENGMSQLSSQSSLVALGETDARRFDLGSVDGGRLRLDEDAGRVAVRIENGTDGETTVYNGSIGTLEYVGEDRTVALQGGGVWTASNGYGRMVSPPEYHYRGTTLTFPIVRLNGTEQSARSGTGVVRRSAGDSDNVTDTANPLDDGTVVVEVQSDYYEGWYEFFSQRADGSVTKYDANRTTVARLTTPIGRNSLLLSSDGVTRGNVDENGYSVGSAFPSPTPLIEEKLEPHRSNYAEGEDGNASDCFDGDGPCTAGVYYANGGLEVGDDVEFDTSDGDVEILVDGDLDVESAALQISDDTDNEVRYYVNGSFYVDDPDIGTAADSIDARRTQFYVRGGGIADGGKGLQGTMDAFVYAPNADLVAAGNAELRGMFVFDSADVRGTIDLTYDPELEGFEIPVESGDEQTTITYLHVSENVVEVDFD